VSDLDPAPDEHDVLAAALPGRELRLVQPREVPLGGVRAMTVSRTLPERSLSTVGAWCFLDEAGPAEHLTRVLPHPHIGLQTVSWLLQGSILHRDTVGSSVLVKPGQLNLMTSGDGIAHSEFTPGERAEPVHLLQLWIALPEHARRGAPHFEQHADLPVVGGDGWSATVLLGEFAGAVSPAGTFTPLVGAEVRIEPGATVELALREDFEHAMLVPLGNVTIEGTTLGSGPLAFLGAARRAIVLTAGDDGATVLLIGGEPLAEDLIMWWNFVGRTHDEIVEARDAWEAHSARFGEVAGHDGARIPAPPLPGIRLTPRRRR
jgi:hypothetical protein